MPSVSRVEYIDDLGRKYEVECPDDDADPAHGRIIGPWFLEELARRGVELPEETATRLHNELYARRILTAEDADKPGSQEALLGAMRSALRVDVMRIREAYRGGVEAGSPNGVHPGLDRGRRGGSESPVRVPGHDEGGRAPVARRRADKPRDPGS